MSWSLSAFVVLGLVLAWGFAWYERTRPPSRVVALVASLAALAALGRVAFAPLPSVKPTVAVAMLAGLSLGAAPGFAVGAVAAFASNMALGQGSWTPWQMVGWGMVGLAGAGLGRVRGQRVSRLELAAVAAAAGFGFGVFMDAGYSWLTFGGGEPGQLWVTLARGLPFDAALAAGDAAFCLAFGPAFLRALGRFRERLEVRWHPAGTVLAVSALALAVALPVADARAAAPRTDAQALARAAAYLRSAQNADGGWGAARGGSSAQLYTGWAAIGLAAAGQRPAAATASYLRAGAGNDRTPGDVERTILALHASGAPVADLAAQLAARQRADGSWLRLVNQTAFGVLALRAAGRPAGDHASRAAASWLARQQNRDGGFSFSSRGGPSDDDDTAAAIQALVQAGRRTTRTVSRAVAFLARHQGRDGGFPLDPGEEDNAQSTAFAVQALVAARRDPAGLHRRGGRSPLAFLRSLVAADGSVRYSRFSAQTPVWVTAQALAALARRPLPVAAPPARAAPAASRSAPARSASARRPAHRAHRRAAPRHRRRASGPHRATALTAANPPAVPAPDTLCGYATLAFEDCATLLRHAGLD